MCIRDRIIIMRRGSTITLFESFIRNVMNVLCFTLYLCLYIIRQIVVITDQTKRSMKITNPPRGGHEQRRKGGVQVDVFVCVHGITVVVKQLHGGKSFVLFIVIVGCLLYKKNHLINFFLPFYALTSKNFDERSYYV